MGAAAGAPAMEQQAVTRVPWRWPRGRHRRRRRALYLEGFRPHGRPGRPTTVDPDTVFQIGVPVQARRRSTDRGGPGGRGRSSTGSHASRISIPPSSCTSPIRPRRSPCAISSATAAGCRASRATISRGSASAATRSCGGCASCRRPPASARATPTAISASPRARSPPRSPPARSWETVAREKLFAPLGMNATGTTHAAFLSRTNRAALHVRADGVWTAAVARNPDAQAPGRRRQRAQPRPRPVAAAGDRQRPLRGTAADRGRGAGADTRAAHGPRPQSRHRRRHVLRARLDHRVSTATASVWGHAGAFSAGAQTLVIDPSGGRLRHPRPDERLSVRRAGGARRQLRRPRLRRPGRPGLGEGLGRSLREPVRAGIAAATAAYGAPPARASAPLALAAYTGRYANAYVGDAVVTRRTAC